MTDQPMLALPMPGTHGADPTHGTHRDARRDEAARRMLDVTRIYAEPAAAASPRGRQVIARWPDADVVEVASHWQIPQVHGDEANVARWVRIKREALVLGEKKTLTVRPNGRSADFIAPSSANGCAMACAYCYVPRRKGYSNPITTFTNIERITAAIRRHVDRQGPKAEPNQCDERAWVYDIGENSDCSVDALVSDNVLDLVTLFAGLSGAKASFATKFVNRDLLDWDPKGGTRVRLSLMPAATARTLDIRTSPMADRLAVLDDLVEAGYEVHVNLSPVVVHDGWLEAWAELLGQLGDATSGRTKAQLACEVIFLTHNEQLHEVNLGWHPQAEQMLWRPDLQEEKRSENGAVNVRYRWQQKQRHLADLSALLAARAPWCRVRYAF
ncbi:spore photoproduct lyase family protein [Terracoccus luteus]|uniref:Spore photoproduct lyase family protein n=1 Tax=Terracoccus luteus TaxID=53356 RepID=A0A495Y215_9MICO|nr:spore photoproduct lyase family protein [Terracoccus luteus]MBB2986523.1 spore photoproduct lyase family protein [Terracoccus luteus]MCP2171888.1 spore photoproduct lyase family protein [Terracoccus luteus]RKT79274.1 spore photoproduct lyase family protein [Terracoccus luteus]